MSESEFKLSGSEVAKLIHQYLMELYPDMQISLDEVGSLVVPSESRGSDVKFLAGQFAENRSCDHEELMRELYLKLAAENDKNWHNRAFYGLFKRAESIYFRLVDDSTT